MIKIHIQVQTCSKTAVRPALLSAVLCLCVLHNNAFIDEHFGGL